MPIKYLLEDIEDYEREIRSLKISLEFYQSQVKLYKRKANAERDYDFIVKLMLSFVDDYTKKYVECRSNLAIAERNLRVAKLRLKRYFKEV